MHQDQNIGLHRFSFKLGSHKSLNPTIEKG